MWDELACLTMMNCLLLNVSLADGGWRIQVSYETIVNEILKITFSKLFKPFLASYKRLMSQ